jgi:hypothetical protein
MKSRSAMMPTTMLSISVVLEAIAKVHVTGAQKEEHDDDCDVDQVTHRNA